MKWILSLLLATVTLFCLGCSSSRGTPDDLVWLKPIKFSEPTKVWLESLDWPEYALEDFKQIYRFNEKLRRMSADTKPAEGTPKLQP
jgi:hypothetical protein